MIKSFHSVYIGLWVSVMCQQFPVITHLMHSLGSAELHLSIKEHWALYPDSEQLRSLLSPHVMIDLFFGWSDVENSIVLINPY